MRITRIVFHGNADEYLKIAHTLDAETAPAPKRRGRPPKAASTDAPRRRGRPPKAASADAPRRRGRPPKAATADAPKRRGRPPKAASADAPKRRGRPPKAESERKQRAPASRKSSGNEVTDLTAIFNSRPLSDGLVDVFQAIGAAGVNGITQADLVRKTGVEGRALGGTLGGFGRRLSLAYSDRPYHLLGDVLKVSERDGDAVYTMTPVGRDAMKAAGVI